MQQASQTYKMAALVLLKTYHSTIIFSNTADLCSRQKYTKESLGFSEARCTANYAVKAGRA